jgi:murein DD-endopeptidase MepM/ murein hydrolase activator NlpD
MVRRRTQSRKKRASYPTLGAQPARSSGGFLLLILGALVLVNLYVFVWDKKTGVAAIKREAEAKSLPAMNVGNAPLAPTGPGAGAPDASAPTAPPGIVEGKVEKSDTLGKLLKRSSLSAAEADEVIRALSGKLDFRQIKAGQPFKIERGGDGRVKLFLLELSKTQKVRAERDGTGELLGIADVTETRVELKALGGSIDSSLYAAIKNAGETGALVDFFVDVFAYDIDFFNDTRDGDTFRIVVEKHFMPAPDGSGEMFAHYGKILSAEYAGKAGTFQTFFWNGKYYESSGASSEKGMLKTPLKFVKVSSGFDRKRMHPVLHTVRAHLGIDYAAPTGTPVRAAASGTIVTRAPSGGAGNMVVLRHEGGLDTVYMHLSKFANQKVGDKVEAKTVIGYVGTTGVSTGPHLHFGVKKNGAFVDPTKLPPMRGKPVPAKELEAFKTESARLTQQMAGISIAPGANNPAAPAAKL